MIGSRDGSMICEISTGDGELRPDESTWRSQALRCPSIRRDAHSSAAQPRCGDESWRNGRFRRLLHPWLRSSSGRLLSRFPASAVADVVLHEYLPPDAVDDLLLGATTTRRSDGCAAIQTETGVAVSSPRTWIRPSERKGFVYGSRALAGLEPANAYHCRRGHDLSRDRSPT